MYVQDYRKGTLFKCSIIFCCFSAAFGGGILTLPFGHLPNTFCFISPSICFISPSNLLRFPKKMLHFPNSLLHFPNKMLHFPNSLLHFPMQCCVTLPKNILTKYSQFFFSSLGLNAISNMSNEHLSLIHI